MYCGVGEHPECGLQYTLRPDALPAGCPSCKTCSLDPIPTWLVKEMRGLLSPFISLLFQKSLFTGLFPTEFKEAIVRPLLKKSGLDSTQKKNYRPVSNLSFLSKLLERVAQARLEVFLDSSDLMPTMQSAYRRFHSTETAVMKVYNDLLLAADNGDVSTLCVKPRRHRPRSPANVHGRTVFVE